MVRINWTFQAKGDLKNIAEYISKDSKYYAKMQVLHLRHRTKILNPHIYSGRMVPEINQSEFRELIEGAYRIIYKIVNQNRVDILTIHHSAQDLGRRKLPFKK